ncbi:hypothetical protein JOB18_031959 [Solea senegalensis]|uniref:Uncharacterized protein n=1 Tax=Solea senegalensis TaxID=28829 RepID=A0AAV6RNL3_SOLSE|nr:hypothetical protein JOB18_031959 [Solea senegalensis]
MIVHRMQCQSTVSPTFDDWQYISNLCNLMCLLVDNSDTGLHNDNDVKGTTMEIYSQSGIDGHVWLVRLHSLTHATNKTV